ncbi:hypothetical protein Y032_0362g3512 [Ancylostoma ceylanicum]|uniref:DAGKc domain-containing protein n=1 Tax=Ancylostoma ceylanicum TaxID=53326 RepID=A0A016RVB9_9BILA|nr:hypothetical protein Y032_0362g3512 [Ancylostoma ceylanicum]
MVVLIVSCLSGSRGLAKYDETFGRVVYRKNAGTTFRPLKKTVETFFKLTPGLKFEVILTQRANHARDYILEMSAEQWQSIDGLVSVGGDGLFNELLSGALLRTQLEAGTNIDDPDSDQLQTPHIRFGIIGAGSANSIVSTVHETADYATAAVHIAIGGHHFLIVCKNFEPYTGCIYTSRGVTHPVQPSQTTSIPMVECVTPGKDAQLSSRIGQFSQPTNHRVRFVPFIPDITLHTLIPIHVAA